MKKIIKIVIFMTVIFIKEHYGLLLNEDEYPIIYHYEGDNLQPTIEVHQREKTL